MLSEGEFSPAVVGHLFLRPGICFFDVLVALCGLLDTLRVQHPAAFLNRSGLGGDFLAYLFDAIRLSWLRGDQT